MLRGFLSLWRLRLLTAFLLSLPVLLLGGWYGWRAWVSHAAYRDAAGEELSLTPELFHLHLHDRIHTDLRRVSLPNLPPASPLPVFSLEISRFNLQNLTRGLTEDSPRPYVPAFVATDGRFLPCSVRIRGGRHWHWAHPQKSLKLMMDPGNYLDGSAIFNLLNEVAPISVGEGIILDLLRDLNVLTPTNRLVRVTINKRNMGVYLFITQVNEGLLRKNRRMYGSLFSGNQAPIDPATKLSSLWRDSKPWKKVGFWKPSEIKSKRELKKLLAMVNEATLGEFAAFAKDQLHLESFASFDAVDAVFGGNQHDWDENHKLYYDPYRGRFEPVAWNFRGWRHEPAFLTVENPLRLRLAFVPGYLALRNRIVYTLLQGPCSVPEIRRRLLREIRRASPEYASDPYWDAYKLLPPVNRALRRMVRPMNGKRQALVLESEIKTFSTRHAYLKGQLEKDAIHLRSGPQENGATPLTLVADGYGAYRIEQVRVSFPPKTPPPSWKLYRDADLDGLFDPTKDVLLAGPLAEDGVSLQDPRLLEPAIRVIPRPNPDPKKGKVALEPAPRAYRFFVVSEPAPTRIQARVRNAVTGWRMLKETGTGSPPVPEPASPPPGSIDHVPAFHPEETSVHPWRFPEISPKAVRLGPGIVLLEETRVFPEGAPVTIEAGTTIRLGPGVSLIFRGPVEARGTGEKEIRIERARADKSFRGVALQGAGTAGSILTHVRIEGGSSPRWTLARYPGMVNLHDTRDVLLRGVQFAGNRKSDDLLHVAYCEGIVIEDCTFEEAHADALDVEFAEVSVRACRFIRPPDEALDLMGAEVDVRDSILVGSGRNAISAGERSTIHLLRSLIASSRTGILVKSRSEATLSGSLFYGNRDAIRLITKSPKYGGRSKVVGDILYAVQCRVPVFVDDRSDPGLSRVVRRFPRDGSLDPLLKNVLGITDWRFLKATLEEKFGK
jgi:hypothetical protein